jgi:uncharacterized protein (DUF4415 family)
MAFEWDEDNRKAHLAKHGVDFRRMTELFDGPTLEASTAAKTTAKPASTRSAKSKAESFSSPIHGAAPTAASSAREKPMTANKENITRVTRDEARQLKDETDYARLDAMTDDDIAHAVADDPTAPPLDIDWDKARLVIPPGKDIITLRLDTDVLDWFRAQGKGYQTRINLALRVFYEASNARGEHAPRVAAVGAKPLKTLKTIKGTTKRGAKPAAKVTVAKRRRA